MVSLNRLNREINGVVRAVAERSAVAGGSVSATKPKTTAEVLPFQAQAAKKPNVKAPNPIDVHVGGKIRLKRKLVGMSQDSLGKALGVTFQQVQKYEKGTNRVGASRLQDIANILKVPVSFFFEDAPGQPGDSAVDGIDSATVFVNSAEGVAHNKAMARLNPKVRAKIVALVKSLGDSE